MASDMASVQSCLSVSFLAITYQVFPCTEIAKLCGYRSDGTSVVLGVNGIDPRSVGSVESET